MRRLFREVRKKFEFKGQAIRLFHVAISLDPDTKKETEIETEFTKNDDQIRKYGLTNGTRFRVKMDPNNPEMFTVFVTMPNGIQKPLQLLEVFMCM